MTYAIFLCILGTCQMVMSQDMLASRAGTVRGDCLYWAEHYSEGLGTRRGPNYEFRCMVRESPWRELGVR